MRSLSRHWSVSTSAALCAALVHVAFIAPLVLGGASHKRPPPPDQPGGGASALSPSARLVEAMTLIDLLHTNPSDEPPLEQLTALGIELPRSAVMVASPELAPLPVLEEDLADESETTQAAGNTQGHAAMFGRYLGQITARIERAWQRPRTPMDPGRFSCQAKIEQNDRGKVLSVELRYCNGDSRWQRSLVSAIEHASPLPAPPVPSVFARMLVLNFSAESWTEGLSNAHHYEPEQRLAEATRTEPGQIVTNEDKSINDVAGHQGHIDLTIEGKALRWTLHDGMPSDPVEAAVAPRTEAVEHGSAL